MTTISPAIKELMRQAVLDEELTHHERQKALGALAVEHFEEFRDILPTEEIFELWNQAMAEIITRYGLGRH